MDLFTDPSLPHWIKIVAMLAMLATAFTVLVRFASYAWGWVRRIVGIADKLDIIIAEVTPNGGGSMKDLIRRAADDSKADLELSRSMRDESHREREKLAAHIQSVRVENKERIDAAMQKVGSLEEKVARYIVHEARNDLQHSRLFEEEQKLLRDRENARKTP